MPREPNPIDDEDLYSCIVLGGMKSPGEVTLSGHDRKIDWDVKEGSGQSGATSTLKGVPLCEFSAVFYLVDAEDFAAWPAFRRQINSTVSAKAPKAYDIYHPDLAANDIVSVVKGTVAGVVHDGKGGQRITVKFQEYKAPKPKGGSPLGSKGKTGPDPDAAAKAELAKLTAQFQALPPT